MRAVALSREAALEDLRLDPHGEASVFVDTYSQAFSCNPGFVTLSPFYYSNEPFLGVPGQPSLRSRSMENVWQSLKIFQGRVDFSILSQSPCKRPRPKERDGDYRYSGVEFLYGEAVIPLRSARLLIYLPSYLELFFSETNDDLRSSLMNEERRLVFYDIDDNFDICDDSSSFSHSKLLECLFNGNLVSYILDSCRGASLPPDLPGAVQSILDGIPEPFRSKRNS